MVNMSRLHREDLQFDPGWAQTFFCFQFSVSGFVANRYIYKDYGHSFLERLNEDQATPCLCWIRLLK